MTLSHVQGHSLLQVFKYDFACVTLWRAIFAVIACLYVCLSQAGVVPKRLQVGSRRQRCRSVAVV